jgi:hypothetical protein
MQGRLRASHGGAGWRARDEAEAERMLAKGLAVLEMPTLS